VAITVAFNVTFAVQRPTRRRNRSISPAVQVKLVDGAGLPVPAADVPQLAISLRVQPGGRDVVGDDRAANVNGVFTFNDLKINNPGNGYRLLASGLLSAPFNS